MSRFPFTYRYDVYSSNLSRFGVHLTRIDINFSAALILFTCNSIISINNSYNFKKLIASMLNLETVQIDISHSSQVGDVVTTIPTIGFNVEQVTYKNLKFQVWDLGGQTSIR